jgi:uncharacterized membrane protein
MAFRLCPMPSRSTSRLRSRNRRVSDTEGQNEGRAGVARIEAFSDGVIAIIVTIMVLELHVPIEEGLDKLWSIWPIFLAYVLSYAFVAIYWVNHHRLFSHAVVVTNGLMWANIALLFTLSLVPFTTAYLGEHHFSREAAQLYLFSTLLPAFAYRWVQSIIVRTGKKGEAAAVYHRRTIRKGVAAAILYLIGLALTFVSPGIGVACAAIVAVLWFVPNSPFDALFDGRGRQRRE